MHEFDRYVRNQLKPQAYLRYGDDFIIVVSTCRQAHAVRLLSKKYLYETLRLQLNPKNDVVVSSRSGLKFLGHNVSAESFTVDKHTTGNILAKITTINIASYRALALEPEVRKQLDWILLQNDLDI